MLTFTAFLKRKMNKAHEMMANVKLEGGDGPLSYDSQIVKFSNAAYCLHLYRHGDRGMLVQTLLREYKEYRDAEYYMLKQEAES